MPGGVGQGTRGMLTTFVKVATVGELADGEMRDASVEGEQILLARFGPTLGTYVGPRGIGVALTRG